MRHELKMLVESKGGRDRRDIGLIVYPSETQRRMPFFALSGRGDRRIGWSIPIPGRAVIAFMWGKW